MLPDLIDFACGQIVLPGQADVQEALIISQIQVHLQGCPCLCTGQACFGCQAAYLQSKPRHHHLVQTPLHVRMVTWCQHLCSSKGLQVQWENRCCRYFDTACKGACGSARECMNAAYKIAPILTEVTRWPQFLRITPMLLAVTPLPSPLTTPPETKTYFIGSFTARGQTCTTDVFPAGPHRRVIVSAEGLLQLRAGCRFQVNSRIGFKRRHPNRACVRRWPPFSVNLL